MDKKCALDAMMERNAREEERDNSALQKTTPRHHVRTEECFVVGVFLVVARWKKKKKKSASLSLSLSVCVCVCVCVSFFVMLNSFLSLNSSAEVKRGLDRHITHRSRPEITRV